MIDTEHFRRRLLLRQEELCGRLRKVEEQLDKTPNPDAEERATEREDDEVLESQGLSGLGELKAVGSALDRIAHGSFGVCLECGEPISTERLNAVPHAIHCRRCMDNVR